MNQPLPDRCLWTAGELEEATAGVLSAPFAASGVSIDTRTLRRGDLFVALRGDGRDGHRFAAEAIGAGAAGAMVHAAVAPGVPALRVDDTLAALHRLGGFARTRFAGRVAAVTGSVGKTTTKEMLRLALSAYGPAHAAAASYNNHWGVPLTLARVPRDAAFCVAEIGMNHPNEIAPLARLVRPHVALITTIAKAHVGNMGSIEAIADEKAGIADGLQPDGIAVLPADSPWLARLRTRIAALSGGARILTFGADAAADVRLLHLEAGAETSVVRADVSGHVASLRVAAPGRHMAMNALAALAGVVALGLDPARAVGALESFQPLSGRGARRVVGLPAGPVLLLDESYNGNGASMRAALDVLRLQPARRRIAVLGDMLELGAHAPAEHAALARPVSATADLVFACGPLMRHLFDALPESRRGAHAPDAAALAPLVADALRNEDVVLVKGSLGSGMKRVIDAIDAASAPPQRVGAA